MTSVVQNEISYLVFDDEDEERNQQHLNVNVSGFLCNLTFLNPKEFYDLETDSFNTTAFTEKIEGDIKGKNIRLVATDWNILQPTGNFQGLNGWNIIDIILNLNEKYKKRQFLIYSGNATDASKTLVDMIQSEIAQNQGKTINGLKLLSNLLELRIKFCSRPQRFDEVKSLLKDEKIISTVVLSSLASVGELTINTGNNDYDGKTIQNLLELIEHNDERGLKFIKEFIELSIANYTELNAQ